MAWTINGQMTEACSCNMFCPCWFGVKEYMVMDRGWCASSLIFQIEEGQSDGVDLSGRTVVLVLDFPGPTLFDGNGTARIYLDDAVTDEQSRELTAIFQGQRGGTMEVVAGLIATWLPVEKASIRVNRDGDEVSADIASVGQVSSKLLRDEQGSSFTIRGGGFVGAFGLDAAELAPTVGTRWSDPGMPRTFETRSGARGAMTMSGG